MFARAHLIRPRLIVADEPVSMIDASLRATIIDIMLKMRDEDGISFLYITHDLSTAYQIGNDIVILYAGRHHRAQAPQAPLRATADRLGAGA
jgi:peptide/nickel transport system ATP-binding protein